MRTLTQDLQARANQYTALAMRHTLAASDMRGELTEDRGTNELTSQRVAELRADIADCERWAGRARSKAAGIEEAIGIIIASI